MPNKYKGYDCDIILCQIRDFPPSQDVKKIVYQLLAIPYFHYARELSDIWILWDCCTGRLLAWAWITPWDEKRDAIRMIDTLVPGHNFARRLICKYGERINYERDVFPHDVVPESEEYWLKEEYERETWLSGNPPKTPVHAE